MASKRRNMFHKNKTQETTEEEMEVDPGWLEVVLNRAERERGVRRVVAAACEDAVGQGDNFGSAMYRIKMDTVLGSGQPATRSLLVKNLPPPGRHRDFIEQFNAFPTEITTYSWVLSELEKLMIEKCDTNEKLWSDCLWYRPYDQIVLSDLKELGYRNIHRADRMDIEHALLTVNSLGRLHGMSAVLLHRGKLDVTRLSPYSMARNQPLMNRLLAVGLETLAAVMRQSWGSQWYLISIEQRNGCSGFTCTSFKELIIMRSAKGFIMSKFLIDAAPYHRSPLASDKMGALRVSRGHAKATYFLLRSSAAEKVSRLAENAGEVLQRLNAEETDKLVVFNHGDCWINNIMFRYGAWTCSPIGLR
ncbi:hypothetical protein AAG570_000683 [Ranatra chinensis]|uniref:CHK kinase-like domain-containing protein n=1 Tax=Ranatra chinensis TaxID=642074 RepID=A0ABD0ZIZ1_9HEMI